MAGRTTLALIVILRLGWAVGADVDYERDVRPLLRGRCGSCHGGLAQEAGLRLDTGSAARLGGESGPAVVPGMPEVSLLIERITGTDAETRMPPEGPALEPRDVALLRAWIAAGAVSPVGEQPEEDPARHWAFQPPRRPPVPQIAGCDHPIDAFLARSRREAGTVPLPPADRATLLRRVSIDLVGLPPTAAEVRTFLADESAGSYEAVVDRLLASPLHAERWARHWMDVWRYSDWYGRRSVPDVMNSYPMIWRWRDWIVRSLEADKPYDRMITEMLAADEIAPDDVDNVVATGFLVRSWFKWNYETWKKDLVEHTGKAFLGLTLNCAQCHDHKYDPISQEDYFRFRAYFEPLELRHDRWPGEKDPGPFEKYVYTKAYGPISSGLVRVFDEYLDAETFMFAKGDSRLRIEGRPPVTPAVPARLASAPADPRPVSLPITAAYPGLRSYVIADERAAREAAVAAARAAAAAPPPPSTTADAVAAAEAAVSAARAAAVPGTGPAPLEGGQSLVVDATSGRRALAHPLPGIAELGADGVISWLVELRTAGHTNLQLGLDIAKGATGGFVAFEDGTIKTYAPGGFAETVVGRYDLAAGQNRFAVTLRLDLDHDRFLLTVRSLEDGAVLVNEVPGAVNGWRPAENASRGLFIDCRPGAVAVYDALTFTTATGRELLGFRFEPAEHADADDVAGVGGWIATSFCQSPATSLVLSTAAGQPAVRDALGRLARARSAARLGELDAVARSAGVAAADAELAAFEARVVADTARFASGDVAADRRQDPQVVPVVATACAAERQAALLRAAAAVATADADIARAAAGAGAADEAARQAVDAARRTREQAAAALEAARARAAAPDGEYTPLGPTYPQRSSGRRTALAGWITSRDNPLTARVAVNQVWMRHMGQPLVATPHDFGRNGARPTHPELLDWLACEFMDAGWSLRHLHRLIVTSAAYRLASDAPAADRTVWQLGTAADRENRTLWRFPVGRMEAEVVRDSLLAVAGVLDTTRGGPEIDQAQGLVSRRRSLYFSHHGEEKMEFLELFDAANPCDCYRRTMSVQPQQALALVNSDLTRGLATELAERLWEPMREGPDGADRFVSDAFVTLLGREPTPAEREATHGFLAAQAARQSGQGDAAKRARCAVVHALFNHNDFVTVR